MTTVRQVTRSEGAAPNPLPGRERKRPENRYPNSDATQRPSELTALLKPSVAGQHGTLSLGAEPSFRPRNSNRATYWA